MKPDRTLNKTRLRLEGLEDRTVPSTFWVKNTLDSGPNSLRQAILDANAHPGADVISFKPAVQGTIKLASELLLTDDLTINGPGSGHVIVSGDHTTRVIDVAASAHVVINDLTIAHGHTTGTDHGAGIWNQGTLTLDSVTVWDNASDSVGGGIENIGALTLERSCVKGNDAVTNAGGIHNAKPGVVTIDRSKVRDNTTVGDGAGIRSEVGTTLTITRSTISGNAGSGFGTGGIASAATLTIRDTLIDHNTSAAAGIYLFGSVNSGDVVISHSVIRDNGPNATSGSGVGGIWSHSSKNILIDKTVIRHNTGNSAGGLFGGGQMQVVDSTIDHNTGGGAGGIEAFGTLMLTRTTVSRNTGSTGGISAGTATIVDSTVSGNTGTRIGGVYAYQLDLTRSTVSGNTAAPVGDGPVAALGVGGVEITNGHIQNSTISGNVVIADQMQGYSYPYGDIRDATGGVFAHAGGGGSAVAIENSTIAFNRVKGAPADIRSTGGAAAGRPFSFTYAGNTYESFTVVGVKNTIIARNQTTVGDPDVGGEMQSGGHNLIGVLAPDATGFVASDQTGSLARPLDPRLEPLANNGGPTKTHALAHNSPAVDAGDNSDSPPTDQRGRSRIAGGIVDIGAYESKASRGGGQGNRGHDKTVWSSIETLGPATPVEPTRQSISGIGSRADDDHPMDSWPESVSRKTAALARPKSIDLELKTPDPTGVSVDSIDAI
jgi:Right handed beta helix region